jgi:putative transposase
VLKGEELQKRLEGRNLSPREIQEEVLRLVEEEKKRLGEIALGRMLRCRVRYFSDGVVIGSRGFVDGLFASARERFGPRRTSGARRMRGNASAAAGRLWSMRDLQTDVK